MKFLRIHLASYLWFSGEESEGLLTQEVHDLVQVVDEQGVDGEESKDLLTERHKGNITL